MVGRREGILLDNTRGVAEASAPFACYGATDAFVSSSFEEASPRVRPGAAILYLHIATTDVNGVPKMLAPDDAWLCPPGDPARPARAKAAVLARFDSLTNRPRHLALAVALASRQP